MARRLASAPVLAASLALAVPAPASALKATAEIVPIPGPVAGLEIAPTSLDVHWEEEGLVPGADVAVSIEVTADSDYACRVVADGTLIERPDLAAHGETGGGHGVAIADERGHASGTTRIWEGDVAGGIGELLIQGRARCPAGTELVRTKLTYKHVVVARDGTSIVVLGPIVHEAFTPPPPAPPAPPAQPVTPQPPAPVAVTVPPATVVIAPPAPQPVTPVQGVGGVPTPAVQPAQTLRVRVVLGACAGGRCRATVTVVGGKGHEVRLQRRRGGTYRVHGPRLRVPSSERLRLRLRPGRYRLLHADGTVLRRFVVRERRVAR